MRERQRGGNGLGSEKAKELGSGLFYKLKKRN
jgi:hypothetical protein